MADERMKRFMDIRIMTINDYEQVYALWVSTPNMGLNNLDDSK